jgi:hypothetical protein
MEEKRIIPLKYRSPSIVALVIILLLAFGNHEIWAQAVEPLQKPQKEETKPLEKKAETLPTTGPVKDTRSTQPQISIAEKNIFSPERKDFLVPGGMSKPIVRPQVVLYGVTIAGDYQAASVSNPGRPLQKGERETFTIRVGEKIGDYKVANISSDRITLEVDGDRFEVLLYDSRTPKKRIEVKTETKPATITSTQAAPTTPAPSTPIPSTPSTPPASAQAPKPSTPPTAVTPPPPATATPAPPATRTPTPYGLGTRGGRAPYSPSPGTSGPTPQGPGGN